MLGNGFHTPSLMLAIIVMLQLGPTLATPTPTPFSPDRLSAVTRLSDPREQALAERFYGSPFDPATFRGHHSMLSVKQLVADMADQFRDLALPATMWGQLARNLRSIDTEFAQAYFVWLGRRGHTAEEAPPSWRPQRERAMTAAALGQQRAPGGSTRGLDHILPPGLGEHRHYEQARQLPSPYSAEVVLDDDLA